MTSLRLPAALAAALVLLASACGGGAGSVPEGAVAVVGETEITRAELDELVAVARKSFAAQKREFPKVGTPEFQAIQSQYLAFLVQREEFEQAAEELGVEVTDADVEKSYREYLNRPPFDGDRKKLREALAEQGMSEDLFRETLRASVLSQKLFDEVTKDVQVTEQDVLAYYTQNQSQYRTPESRDVRHILIAEKKGDEVDYAKSKAEADRLYAQLRAGADFAELAKRFSDDPGSKDSGGKLTIRRGETVPEFDRTAFDLARGVVSRPVKTEYGYHLIEALSPVRKAKVTPLDEVRESIKATLLQQKRTEVMREWVDELTKKYEGKVSYATGFEPPELPEQTETETE
ncbi:MAG TPA: peptidylprolyl isomerase [Gaiellaceae bacterium]|nr:peptidylprolyl isomerase [Gaiellaceae bacterium]